MKTKLRNLILVSCLLCLSWFTSGCSTTVVERIDPDGTKFRATNYRSFWKSEGVDVTYERKGNDVSARARLDKSGTDAETLRAVAEGAAKGATGK